MSTYNVAPQQAGQYFNKIQCFCFEEQRLRPGEKIDMPVFFYIDPEFATDPKMKGINTITLRCAGAGEGQGSGQWGSRRRQRAAVHCKVGADRRCASSACTAPELAGRSSNVPLLPPCCCAWPAAILSSKPRRRSLRRRSPQQQQQRQRQHLVSPPWRPSKTAGGATILSRKCALPAA